MKIAPANIKIVSTGDRKDSENAEIFADFLENIEEFQQKFDVAAKESVGRVKTQVVDIKQLKKKQKGLF